MLFSFCCWVCPYWIVRSQRHCELFRGNNKILKMRELILPAATKEKTVVGQVQNRVVDRLVVWFPLAVEKLFQASHFRTHQVEELLCRGGTCDLTGIFEVSQSILLSCVVITLLEDGVGHALCELCESLALCFSCRFHKFL